MERRSTHQDSKRPEIQQIICIEARKDNPETLGLYTVQSAAEANILEVNCIYIVLVHSRRRFLRGVPSQFTESVKNSKYSALHACLYMHWHVRTLNWLYPAEFNQRNRIRSAQCN